MLQPLQHSLRWISIPLIAVAAGAVLWPSAAPSQVPDKLPVVGPVKHKAFTEKLDEKVSFDMLPIPGGTS